MDVIERCLAYFSGHRLLRLRLKAAPREGGYVFVNTPDLPGFSVMLKPDELDDFDALVTLVGKPLVDFVNAEHRAAQAFKDGGRVRLAGLQHSKRSEIRAELCAQPA